MIHVEGLSKKFAIGHALRDVTFSVPAGEVCGLIGPNGAGKTTLLRILATLLPPTGGKAWVAGRDVGLEPNEVRTRIGYMPDTFAGDGELWVEGYLEFFSHVYRLPRLESQRTIDDILRLVDLTHLRNRSISGLSLGARQRLSLGRVLLHDPEVLLLDEPVSGLDPMARVEMRALLKELGRMGRTVLISSHVLSDLADLCGRLLVLDRGEVVFQGTLSELRRRVAPERSLEVVIDGDVDSAVRFLSNEAWVAEAAQSGGGGVVLSLKDPSTSPADVSSALFSRGFRLLRFVERQVDLEEAFLRIIGRIRP